MISLSRLIVGTDRTDKFILGLREESDKQLSLDVLEDLGGVEDLIRGNLLDTKRLVDINIYYTDINYSNSYVVSVWVTENLNYQIVKLQDHYILFSRYILKGVYQNYANYEVVKKVPDSLILEFTNYIISSDEDSLYSPGCLKDENIYKFTSLKRAIKFLNKYITKNF